MGPRASRRPCEVAEELGGVVGQVHPGLAQRRCGRPGRWSARTPRRGRPAATARRRLRGGPGLAGSGRADQDLRPPVAGHREERGGRLVQPQPRAGRLLRRVALAPRGLCAVPGSAPRRAPAPRAEPGPRRAAAPPAQAQPAARPAPEPATSRRSSMVSCASVVYRVPPCGR